MPRLTTPGCSRPRARASGTRRHEKQEETCPLQAQHTCRTCSPAQPRGPATPAQARACGGDGSGLYPQGRGQVLPTVRRATGLGSDPAQTWEVPRRPPARAPTTQGPGDLVPLATALPPRQQLAGHQASVATWCWPWALPCLLRSPFWEACFSVLPWYSKPTADCDHRDKKGSHFEHPYGITLNSRDTWRS